MTRGRVTVKEYAAFAYDAYFESLQPTQPELPTDWKLFEPCPESFKLYGYFGSSYIKVSLEDKTIDLVIAHRGTDNFYGVIEDIRLWLSSSAPQQFQYAVKPFVKHVIDTINKQYSPDEYQVNWFVTGHSLGATLAELTIADNEMISMSGLSFESPGSVPLIEHMQKNGSLPESALAYVRSIDKSGNLVAVSINARPDGINTFQLTPNQPVGPVPVPNIYPPNLLNVLPIMPGYLDYISYSFCVEHPMKNILEWINSNDISKLPATVKPWPKGFFAGYQWYKSYVENQDYWDGYVHELWDKNGRLSTLIQTAFSYSFETFKGYYIDYFLYQTCESTEQQNKAEAFLEFVIEHQPKSAPSLLKSTALCMPELSELTKYLPDAGAPPSNILDADDIKNEDNQHLVSIVGLFKQPQTKVHSSSNAIDYTNSF